MYKEPKANNNIILNQLPSFINCLSNCVYYKHTIQTVQSVKKYTLMEAINTALEQLKAKALENDLKCSYCLNVISLTRCAVYRKVFSKTVLYTINCIWYLNWYDD